MMHSASVLTTSRAFTELDREPLTSYEPRSSNNGEKQTPDAEPNSPTDGKIPA